MQPAVSSPLRRGDHRGILLLLIDNPPVNALGIDRRRAPSVRGRDNVEKVYAAWWPSGA